MIGKIIFMNRRQRQALARPRHMKRLREAVFALTRYIVDADPHAMVEAAGRDILSITNYAAAVEEAGIEPGEKVEAVGLRNLIGDNLAAWQAQMLAVAARAPKVKSAVLHIILSLHPEECWSLDQREEAIDIVLSTLRLQHCQVLWAEHGNTQNPHLHLTVVRVDPRTGLAAGSDWLVDDLHQSLALIEERQGRIREPGALYTAREGAVFDADTGALVRDTEGRYISDWYKQSGKKHDRTPADLRMRRAELIAAAAEAQSWQELHAAFSAVEVQYDGAGSGARIALGQQSTTASQVHRSLARGALEKRLGKFEPDIHRLDAGYEAFRHALDNQIAELRLRRSAECGRLHTWASAAIATLDQAEKRFVSRGIRDEAEEAKKALQEAFAVTIKKCTDQRLSLDKWIAAGRPTYRQVSTPTVLLPANVNGLERGGLDAGRFATRNNGWSTTYLDEANKPLFTDHRVAIIVHQIDRLATIDEALRIGAARWGSVSVRGPDAFVELATARAAAQGISIRNEEGEPLHTNEAVRQRAPQSSPSAEKPKPRDPELEFHRILRIVNDHPDLPMQRRRMPGDVGTTRSGPLEIVDRENGPLADCQDSWITDPRIQKRLEMKRAHLLYRLRQHIRDSGVERVPDTMRGILDLLPPAAEIQSPVKAALFDSDFAEMLRQVREQMLERQRKRAPARSASDTDGYTVAQMMHFQQNSGKGR